MPRATTCACGPLRLWAAMAVAFAWRTWRTKAIHSTLWLLGVIGVLALVAFKYPGTRFAHLSAADLHHGLLAVLAALTLPAGVVLTCQGLWRAGTSAPARARRVVGYGARPHAARALARRSRPCCRGEAQKPCRAGRNAAAVDAFRKPPAINFADVDGYEREKLAPPGDPSRCCASGDRRRRRPALRPARQWQVAAGGRHGELGVPILRINYADQFDVGRPHQSENLRRTGRGVQVSCRRGRDL